MSKAVGIPGLINLLKSRGPDIIHVVTPIGALYGGNDAVPLPIRGPASDDGCCYRSWQMAIQSENTPHSDNLGAVVSFTDRTGGFPPNDGHRMSSRGSLHNMLRSHSGA